MKKGAISLKDKLPLFFKSLFKKETPWYAKGLVIFTIAYAILPFDLMPAWLGPLGLLDDALLIPLMANLVVKMLPHDMVAEQVSDGEPNEGSRSRKQAKKIED